MDSRKLQPIRRAAAGTALVTVLLAGCSRTVYVPQVEVRTEYRERAVHDTTIVERERVERLAGDTVYVEVLRNVYRVTVRTDTVVVRDSIPVPHETIRIREVARRKTPWEKGMQRLGETCLAAAVAMGVLFAVKRKR